MNVAIVGAGNIGSAIAFSFIFHPKIENVFLSDINTGKLVGELNDLNAASLQLVDDELFSEWKGQDVDYVFICAGSARKDFESDESLFEKNVAVVDECLSNLPKEKCYILTNPSKMLGEFFHCRYLGNRLDEIRSEFGLMNGWEVLSLKGYTNWGIAAEAWKAIRY